MEWVMRIYSNQPWGLRVDSSGENWLFVEEAYMSEEGREKIELISIIVHAILVVPAHSQPLE